MPWGHEAGTSLAEDFQSDDGAEGDQRRDQEGAEEAKGLRQIVLDADLAERTTVDDAAQPVTGD